MKIRHRRAHLLVWLVIGPLILIGLVTGTVSRPGFPVESFVPDSPPQQIDLLDTGAQQ